MTRLLVLSDLHLEHRPAWSMPQSFPTFDVAVFAGDIDGSPERAVMRLANEPGLAGRPIVFVPGNHEFYRDAIEERLATGRAAAVGTNVHLLDRGAIILAGVRFVGATLWADYRLHGNPRTAKAACQHVLADHRLIEIGPPHARRRFRPEDAAARHAADLAFIEATLTEPFAGPTVVVTHHASHRVSLAARFAADPASAGFVSDLEGTILRGKPDLWIHGHVHDSVDDRVGATRILANPKGYGPRYHHDDPPENRSFDAALVVDVQGGAAGTTETIPVVCWTIIGVRATGTKHVLGYRATTGRGRTSSPIRSFDSVSRTATTSSGNHYVLVGEPSADGLDDPLVLHWLAAADLRRRDVEIVDVGT